MNKRLKTIQKLVKKHKKAIRKIGLPLILGLLIFGLGMLTQKIYMSNQKPTNLVWAIDNTVQVPSDLRKFLGRQDNCRQYRGSGSPTGVGLWSVIQVAQGRYAKISYGCSFSLSGYIMAVKPAKTWMLLPPSSYFSSTSSGVANCEQVTKYKIPPTIESFCVNNSGQIVNNPTPL